MSLERATYGRLTPLSISCALRSGVLSADAEHECKRVSAENDNLRAYKAAQRGTLAYYREEVTRLRRERPVPSQYVALGIIIGVVVMAVVWWIVDLLLFDYAITMQYMDTWTAVRTWFLALGLGSIVGYCARCDFLRACRMDDKSKGENANEG